MDIVATIIAALIGAGSTLLVTWINKRKSRADLEKIAADKVAVEVAALRGSLESVRQYAAELQDRITELDAALEAERQLRRRLERKFDAVIAWVRTVAPEADVDGFLAKLETGPL